MSCCCWSTLWLEKHPAYPNPEVQNRERKCTRGALPDIYRLVKEPGYVGTGGQHESLMANQDPDLGIGRDLCCVVSVDDVVIQASHATVVEETPVEETTPPPLLTNPEPEPVPTEAAPPADVAEHYDNSTNLELHSGAFHGRHNHTNTSNHSNHSNPSNASGLPFGASLAHTRREAIEEDAIGSEFE